MADDITAKYDIEDLLKKGEILEIHPQGYSMYPLLVPGRDTAIIQKVDTDHIKKGDVLLYRRENSILVLHRVWKMHENELYMVGDNQKEVEGPLALSQVRGIMIALKHGGREISTDSWGYMVLTGIWLWMRPVRFVIMRPLARIKKGMKKLMKRDH